MAKTNEIIENPVIGDKMQFLTTAKDSNGKTLKFKVWFKTGAQGPPEHMHPIQTEIFEVISGTAEFTLNGKQQNLVAGQRITVHPDAKHKFRNAGDSELIMSVELMPALKSEFFLETFYSLAKKGMTDKNSVPKNFLHWMTILNEYYGEQFIVGPPIFMQKIMSKIFGGVGKLLGYKGFIPYERN